MVYYEARGAVIDRSVRLSAVRGGFAAILLTADAPENQALCAAYVARLRPEVVASEAQIAAWPHDAGEIDRPVYWPVRAPLAKAAVPNCEILLAQYDFARARALRDTLRLRGSGPFLVVANGGKASPGFVRLGGFDLHDVPDDEIGKTLGAFSDYFAQDEQRWRPDLLKHALLRQHCKVFLDRGLGPRMWVLLDLKSAGKEG